MAHVPRAVEEFLAGERIAVAGVSRDPHQPANAIFRRLRDTGHQVMAVNPNAAEVEGVAAYPDLETIPGAIDSVMVVTHPGASANVVRQAADRGVRKIWFHRSFGDGSVSPEALAECAARGIQPIVGGCPMMYAGRVDPAHRCMKWFLNLRHRVPR